MTTQAVIANQIDDCCDVVGAGRPVGWERSARSARRLSWLSLGWMTVEGVVGLAAGIAAGSIALIGWALGSAVEGLASVIVIWRFTGSRTLSESSERRAQQAVAVSFWLLAPYLAVEAARDLLGHHHPGSSAVGMALTASSVVVMPALGLAKRRLGHTLGSAATAGEGTQNLLCVAQGAAVLVGLAVNTTLGWWWLDSIVAIVLAGWAVREGIDAWRGGDCC